MMRCYYEIRIANFVRYSKVLGWGSKMSEIMSDSGI